MYHTGKVTFNGFFNKRPARPNDLVAIVAGPYGEHFAFTNKEAGAILLCREFDKLLERALNTNQLGSLTRAINQMTKEWTLAAGSE